MNCCNSEDFVGGIILIAIGVLLLLSNIYGLNFWVIIGTYWPLILVFVGAKIILDSRKKK